MLADGRERQEYIKYTGERIDQKWEILIHISFVFCLNGEANLLLCQNPSP